MIFVQVLPVSTVDEMVQADMSQAEAWLLGVVEVSHPPKVPNSEHIPVNMWKYLL